MGFRRASSGFLEPRRRAAELGRTRAAPRQQAPRDQAPRRRLLTNMYVSKAAAHCSVNRVFAAPHCPDNRRIQTGSRPVVAASVHRGSTVGPPRVHTPAGAFSVSGKEVGAVFPQPPPAAPEIAPRARAARAALRPPHRSARREGRGNAPGRSTRRRSPPAAAAPAGRSATARPPGREPIRAGAASPGLAGFAGLAGLSSSRIENAGPRLPRRSAPPARRSWDCRAEARWKAPPGTCRKRPRPRLRGGCPPRSDRRSG